MQVVAFKFLPTTKQMFQTLLDSVRSVKTKIFSQEEIEQSPFKDQEIEQIPDDETFVKLDIVDILLDSTLLFQDYRNLALIDPLTRDEVVALRMLLDFSVEMYSEPSQEFYHAFSNELNMNLDDTMQIVYDRVRQDFDTLEAEFHWTNVGSVEFVLKTLLQKFQEVDFGTKDTDSHLDIKSASLVATCLEDIIKKRYEFIKQVYYTIVCFKHLTVPSRLSVPLQWQWQSLFLCYSRLLHISNLAEDDLLENLIHQHMQFPIQEDDDHATYIQKCSLIALGKLGMTRAFPYNSVEESVEVLKWAQIIKQYWPPHKLVYFLDALPVSAGQLVLKAQCWLEMNYPEKAYWSLIRAGSNVQFGQSGLPQVVGMPEVRNIGLVLPPHVVSDLGNYYKYCIQICQEKSFHDLCVNFGKLAMQIDVRIIKCSMMMSN